MSMKQLLTLLFIALSVAVNAQKTTISKDSLDRLIRVYDELKSYYVFLNYNKYKVYPDKYRSEIPNTDKQAVEWEKKALYYLDLYSETYELKEKIFPYKVPPLPNNKECLQKIDSLLQLVPNDKIYK